MIKDIAFLFLKCTYHLFCFGQAVNLCIQFFHVCFYLLFGFDSHVLGKFSIFQLKQCFNNKKEKTKSKKNKNQKWTNKKMRTMPKINRVSMFYEKAVVLTLSITLFLIMMNVHVSDSFNNFHQYITHITLTKSPFILRFNFLTWFRRAFTSVWSACLPT